MAFAAGGGGGGAACGGGVFSSFNHPTHPNFQRNHNLCIFTICGHGEVVGPRASRTSTATGNAQFFSLELPSLTVARVMPMESCAPAISQTFKNAIPTNFWFHIPLMTQVVNAQKDSLRDAEQYNKIGIPSNFLPLGRTIMDGIRDIDKRAGVIYTKEASSNPELVTGDPFYPTYKVDYTNFNLSQNRVIWVRPNQGEDLRPSGLPCRRSVDGPPVFPFYGLFVILVEGGILPKACTLTGTTEDLILPNELGPEFTMFDPTKVNRYNLLARGNRVDVETKIGISKEFLTYDRKHEVCVAVDAAKDAAWARYKLEITGAIQILRRAIVYKHISHIEAAILLKALGYTDLLLVDSACNCPGKFEPLEAVIDSCDVDMPGTPQDTERFWDANDSDQAGEDAAAAARSAFIPPGQRAFASVSHEVVLTDEFMYTSDTAAALAAAPAAAAQHDLMGGLWEGGSKRKKSRKRLLSKNRKRQKCRRTRRKRYTRRRR
jgi:hypothetical protein